MNYLKIKVTNPYYEKEYITDRSADEWTNFLNNFLRENVEIFTFVDTSGSIVAINPSNFASVEVMEVQEKYEKARTREWEILEYKET